MRGPVRAWRRETGEAVSEHACVFVCKVKKQFHQSGAQVWTSAVPQQQARNLQFRLVWTRSLVPTLPQGSVFVQTKVYSTILPTVCLMSWFICSNLPRSFSFVRERSCQVCQSLWFIIHVCSTSNAITQALTTWCRSHACPLTLQLAWLLNIL